jgi:hypothetical protein
VGSCLETTRAADACVMQPQTLNGLLLALVDAEMYAPIWTPELLDGVERNRYGDTFGRTPERTARRIAQMLAVFPFAEEEARGYRELIPAMPTPPKIGTCWWPETGNRHARSASCSVHRWRGFVERAVEHRLRPGRTRARSARR